MKTTNWKDIAELVGLAAIVGSLIFVGLQMKQSQEIALSVAQQTRADTSINLLVASAENPYFVSALAKWQGTDREPLTPEEFAEMSQYANALLYQYESDMFQYEFGFRTQSRWLASKRTMQNFLSDDSPIPLRTTFESNRNNWEPEFQNVVNGLIEQIDSGTER